MAEPLAIFVYGTLKRGEARERCWPRQPLNVEVATVRGALYDLGPYPALVDGNDMVVGELWHFVAEDLPAVLDSLDQVEGYSDGANDLYRRVVIECQTRGRTVRAWTYLYARVDELRKRSACRRTKRAYVFGRGQSGSQF